MTSWASDILNFHFLLMACTFDERLVRWIYSAFIAIGFIFDAVSMPVERLENLTIFVHLPVLFLETEVLQDNEWVDEATMFL